MTPTQPDNTRVRARHRGRPSAPVSAAKTPVSSTALAALGLVWALVLLGLGAVGVHDALVAAGLLAPPQWTAWTLEQAQGLTPGVGVLAVATLAGLLGLALLWLGLRPRRRRGYRVGAQAGTFVRRRQLTRLVAARVQTLDGVTSASAAVRRRTLAVRVRGVDGVDTADLRSRAQRLVETDLAVLDAPPKVRVGVEGVSR